MLHPAAKEEVIKCGTKRVATVCNLDDSCPGVVPKERQRGLRLLRLLQRPLQACFPSSVPALLERADRAFSTGAYDDAIRDYEQGLRLSPPSNEREQALFRLSLAYVLRSANPDWPRATMLLKQLVERISQRRSQNHRRR